MGAATGEGLPALGWPWDQLADATLRWAAARDRHHAATVAGDVNAREAAAADRWRAEQDRAAVRDDVARLWLAGFRAATELHPEAVAALFDRLVADVPPAAGVAVAIQELEDRVDVAEDAVVKLLTRRAV
jgi:hypothetical protein